MSAGPPETDSHYLDCGQTADILQPSKRNRNVSPVKRKCNCSQHKRTIRIKEGGCRHTDCWPQTFTTSPSTSRINSRVTSPPASPSPIFQHSLLYQHSFFSNLHHCCILCDQCLIEQYKRELEAPPTLMAGVTRRMLHTAPVNKSQLLRGAWLCGCLQQPQS